MRSDMGCGSTIGPILATLSGILTIDVGSPQFSMHSIREMMGTSDIWHGEYGSSGTVICCSPVLCCAVLCSALK